MTRLTPDLIEGVPDDAMDLDSRLLKATGKRLKELVTDAAELPRNCDFSGYTAAVVPVTCGMGIIGGFAESVNAILGRLGMRSHVTIGTDVKGFSEAIMDDTDIVFMADDAIFIAYNVRQKKYITNFYGTALGYSEVLREASGGIRGKDVLVIGAGQVGSRAAVILRDMGAEVTVTDKIPEKATYVGVMNGVKVDTDVELALSKHKYVINAAPAIFPGRLISEGAVISSPGVPHYYDEESWVKAKAIIHDPLEIGVATMAACAVSFFYDSRGFSR